MSEQTGLSVGSMPAPPPEPATVWHRLDPRMIVVRPLHELVGFIPALAILLVTGDGEPWRLGIGAVAIGVLLARGVLVWAVTVYRVTDEQVELRGGLLSRRNRSVQRDRIRTVEANARFGHRLFGLAEVRIGTGQSEMSQHGTFNLDAVTAGEADRLRKVLLLRGPSAVSTVESAAAEDRPGEVLAAIEAKWLRFAPLTLYGLAAVAAMVGTAFRLFDELHVSPSGIGPVRDLLVWVRDTPTFTIVLVAVPVVLVLATLGSVLGYLLRFWNYRLTRERDATLRVRRGLLTTRSVSIEEARLRGVTVHEPLLMRMARGARLTAISTGLGLGRDSNLLLPPAPLAEAHRVAGAALRVPESPVAADLLRHPAAALRRRLVRAVVPVVVLIAVLALAGVPDWPLALLLLVPAVLLAVDRYRSLGHRLTERYLVVRSGSLPRSSSAVQRDGIIGWQFKQSFFQRMAGLTTVTATTAAGAYHVLDVAEPDGVRLAEEAVPGLLTPFVHRT